MTADFGRIDCLDISAYQGLVDPACVETKVPASCRDIIINVDQPGQGLPDVTVGNAQRFLDRNWRVSLYHELQPGVSGAQQALTVGNRTAHVTGWHRHVCVYELNPTLPAPNILTDYIAAIAPICGRYRPVINTNVSTWQQIPADVKTFLRTHCDGMLSDYTPPTDLPADFPAMVVNQWGGIDATACCAGQNKRIDCSSLGDGWAHKEEPHVLLVKGTPDAVYVVGPDGKRHVEVDEYNAWLATGLKLQILPDAAIAGIPDIITIGQVQTITSAAAQIVTQAIPTSGAMLDPVKTGAAIVANLPPGILVIPAR